MFALMGAPGGGVLLVAGPEPARRLHRRVDGLVELLDRRAPSADADPLAAAVGLDGPGEPPDDPALARLLPAGYEDDDAAAAEFRRFTESDLVRAKRENADTVRTGLRSLPGLLHLEAAALPAWLGTLNDIRIVLGERLDIRDDEQDIEAEIGPADERWEDLDDYRWLTALVDQLVGVMAHGLPHTEATPEDVQELEKALDEIARSSGGAHRDDPDARGGGRHDRDDDI